MKTLADLLGFEGDSPEVLRARALVSEDRRFLRSLAEMRRARGLTQDDVAKLLGVTQPTVAAFERYDSDPKLSTVRRYAQALGILTCHAAQFDEGQLVRGEWPPREWVQIAATIAPDVRTVAQAAGVYPVDNDRADFALAA